MYVCILLDYFQILQSDDFFFEYLENEEKSKKISCMFFDRLFHIKNHAERVRHHHPVLIQLSRNAPCMKNIKKYKNMVDADTVNWEMSGKKLVKESGKCQD